MLVSKFIVSLPDYIVDKQAIVNCQDLMSKVQSVGLHCIMVIFCWGSYQILSSLSIRFLSVRINFIKKTQAAECFACPSLAGFFFAFFVCG